MLSATGSALVAGGIPENPSMHKHLYVRALRAFYLAGKPVKVGEVVLVPHVLAQELRGAHKAEITEAPAAKPAPKKEESKHAG